MRIRQPASPTMLLIAILMLTGCDLINGDQKNLDAEAIGYACRVSQKVPENCMKENEAQSPTSILKGWKAADRDIEEQVIDPTMGIKSATTAHSAVEGEGIPATRKGAEKAVVEKDEKVTTPTKPDKGTAEKKAAH
ncbi:MAG: hypothetical protein A2Z94_00495 [Gallionellales bacterium GWA2_55_18]|nr:MAG: hypothetical protein A2Z94_00495 [Gallionellales bacterium GWA2_55_18]